ncbi:hypothetical protein ACIRRA_45110 [Nocardia sp. NPDC101769]|uniref:hypothetical protein n=1 Tax=Nocardia sp. NPDC101769 TaxID=3364333 RepID=UPI00381C653F
MGFGEGREVLRQLLQDHLDLRAAREEAELTDRHASGSVRGRNRLEHGHIRQLATVVGSVRVRRCALRAPGRRNIYPADAVLSLPAGRHSHGLRRLAVLDVVQSSYDTTKSAIDLGHGEFTIDWHTDDAAGDNEPTEAR